MRVSLTTDTGATDQLLDEPRWPPGTDNDPHSGPCLRVGYPTYAVNMFLPAFVARCQCPEWRTPDVPGAVFRLALCGCGAANARKYSPDLIGARGRGPP